MTLQLNPEQARIVDEAILAGLIRTPDEVVSAGIDALRDRLAAHRNDATTGESAAAWIRDLRAWSESHSSSTPLLPDTAIDRDSIYGTRGL